MREVLSSSVSSTGYLKQMASEMEELVRRNPGNRAGINFVGMHGPRVVLIGYKDGFSIWEVERTAREMVSDTSVANVNNMDLLDTDRVALGTCAVDENDSAGTCPIDDETHQVKIFNIQEGKVVKVLEVDGSVIRIESNARYLIVSTDKTLCLFSKDTLERTCEYPCFQGGVFALSTGWIAYGGTIPVTGTPEDRTTYTSENITEWTASVSNVARGVAAGIVSLSLRQLEKHRDEKKRDEPPPPPPTLISTGIGSIIVRDIETGKIIAHFQSHKSQLAYLIFDPSGILLASASVEGQMINVHQIVPRRPDSDKPSHQFLYIFQRGITHAVIKNISFSEDIRWVSVSSARGTTHIFPLCSTGGAVTRFTHPTCDSRNSQSLADSLRETISSFSSSLVGHASSSLPSASNISTSWGSSGSSSFTDDKPILKRMIPGIQPNHSGMKPIALDAYSRIRQAARNEEMGPICARFLHGNLRLLSVSGILEEYELIPKVAENNQMELVLEIWPVRSWYINHRIRDEDHTSVFHPLTNAPSKPPPSGFDTQRIEWLALVEIQNFQKPLAQIWSTPQFKFGTYKNPQNNWENTNDINFVQVRGAGPVAKFQSELIDDALSTSDIKEAINTPASFEDLFIPDDEDIDQHVLVFDDDFHCDTSESLETT